MQRLLSAIFDFYVEIIAIQKSCKKDLPSTLGADSPAAACCHGLNIQVCAGTFRSRLGYDARPLALHCACPTITFFYKTTVQGRLVAQLVEHLPWAQVVILGSWDRVLRRAPCSAWSLLLPLLLPFPSAFALFLFLSLLLSLSNKQINSLKKKYNHSTTVKKFTLI